MAELEVYEDSHGDWRWRLIADNGRVIADGSEGYTERNDCIEAVDRVAAAFRE